MGAPPRKPFDGYWQARRGQYRVRYSIDEASRTVKVVDISHRQDAYR
jgi:mRNA-degrading endonuclease RelE of RelBE toxin-antitoxin system